MKSTALPVPILTLGFPSGRVVVGFFAATGLAACKVGLVLGCMARNWFAKRNCNKKADNLVRVLDKGVMGHFEERTPKIKRVSKYILILVFVCGLSIVFGRSVAMIALSTFIPPFLYIHMYYLPRKKSINGWTGEPKRKYYEFRGWNKDIFSK